MLVLLKESPLLPRWTLRTDQQRQVLEKFPPTESPGSTIIIASVDLMKESVLEDGTKNRWRLSQREDQRMSPIFFARHVQALCGSWKVTVAMISCCFPSRERYAPTRDAVYGTFSKASVWYGFCLLSTLTSTMANDPYLNPRSCEHSHPEFAVSF